MTPEDWDSWRSDPLTTLAFKELAALAEVQWGRQAKTMAEDGYAQLFGSVHDQVYYARLRGHVECVNELTEALKKPLSELKTDEEE